MITSLGAGSGLDLQGLVDRLVAAERAPALQRLAVREASLQARFSAFASLRSAADVLHSAMTALKELAPGKATSVSGAIEALTASASDAAALGSYTVTVDQLARAHALATTSFASASDLVGSGTLTITFGTTDYDPATDTYASFTANPARSPVAIEIGPGSQTLSEIRDAINAAQAGLSAVIVGGAGDYHLLISADSTGADNSIEIRVADDDGNDIDAAGLSRLAFNNNATHLDQTAAAADAQFSINGLSLVSASNNGIEVIDGLTLDLIAITSEGPAEVKVFDRTSSVRSALEDFAGAYNELVDLVAELAKYDPQSGEVGALFGDTTLRGMMQSLRSHLSVTGSNGPGRSSSLIEIGLETDDAGHLSVDRERLDEVLADDFQSALAFLNGAGDSYLKIADGYLGSDGMLQARSDGIQTRLDGIVEQRTVLDVRTERLEARLTRRFASLDILLAGLRTTSEFIASQFALLNALRGDR